MTLITLFTDASYDQRNDTAGWGAWGRTDAKRVYNGGGVNHAVKDSTEAELIAVWEGISMLKRALMISPADEIIIQTDNIRAVTTLPYTWAHNSPPGKGPSNKHKRPIPRTFHEERIFAALDSFTQEYPGVKLIGRHVKGHSHKRTGEKRNYINSLCDQLANRGRKRAQEVLERHGLPDPKNPLALFPLLLYPMERVEIYKERAIINKPPPSPIIDLREIN